MVRGTVKNANVDDLCRVKNVRMTYNNEPGNFWIDNATATMINTGFKSTASENNKGTSTLPSSA